MIAAWLAAAALAVLPPEAAADGVARLLSTRAEEAGEEDVVRGLASLGPDAIPVLVLCATGDVNRVVPPEGLGDPSTLAVPPDRVPQVAEAALAALPADAVQKALARHLTADRSLEARGAAARWLRAAATLEGVELGLAVLRASSAAELATPYLGGALEGGLAAALERHDDALARVERGLKGLDRAQLALVVRALARAGRGDAAGLLVALQKTDPDLAPALLDALGRVARERPFELDLDLAPALLAGLSSGMPAVRAAAARAAGEADAAGAAFGLIEALGDAAPEVRAAARAALRRLAGVDHGYDAAAWALAAERERRFAEGEALELLLGRIASEDALEAASALREVGSHRFSRAVLGRRVGDALAGYDPPTARAAAAALAALDARTAVPGLVALLAAAREPETARAAHAALVRLTGNELPAEPQAWRRWLDRE